MTAFLRYLALSLALLCPAAAQGVEVAPETYQRLNRDLVRHHVLARYQRLAVATSALHAAAEGYCRRSDAEALARLRADYNDTMDAWMGVAHLRFGPIELFMRGPRFYFWPQARGRFASAIAELSPQAQASSDTLQKASVAAQGLPALELLLYDDALAARRCPLAETIAVNLRRMADKTLAEWQVGGKAYERTVTATGPDNPVYQSPREATLAFFQGLHDALQLIADAKLKPVLGTFAETAKPALAESIPSRRSLANIVVQLEALQGLYLGEGGMGFAALVEAGGKDTELGPLLRRAFAQTLENARSIGLPVEAAATDAAARPRAEKLLTQVLALKQIVRTRLAAALGLSVGFNALDGD